MSTASSPEEAIQTGSVAIEALILSNAAASDSNASLVYGGFLLVLLQNVIILGSQIYVSKTLLPVLLINKLMMRIVTEIRCEVKRKKLKLPRPKLKDYFFKNRKNKDFCFKYYRMRRKKFKFLSKNVSLPVLYSKKLIIKRPKMVEPIPVL